MGGRSNGGSRWRTAGLMAVAVLTLGGCVGSVSRAEFDEMVVARGGGLVSELPLDAIAAVEDQLGVDSVTLEQITITPQARTVGLTVQDPTRPENLDRYTFREGDLADPQPVQISAGDDVGARLFALEDVPALSTLEELGEQALRELRMDDAVATSVSVRHVEGGVHVQLSLESERSRGIAVFDADGVLVEAERL